MKKLLLLISLFLSAPALAQPGPGPVPNPWMVNGAQVFYNQGCVTITSVRPGTCHGVGTLTVDTLYAGSIVSSGLVTTLSFGTTGFTPSTATSGAITVAGTLVTANGGTGIPSYTVGDFLYASGATTLSKLADVATGNALISGGIGVAASYGKIGLTTHVSGTLAVGNGGTGAATFTANGVIYGNNTSAFGVTAAGTNGQYFKGVTSGAPVWANLASDTVSTISFGTTGLTPNSATAGAVSVAGTLIAVNGGTGFASYAVGDLLYADTTTTLAKRADVAAGQVFMSGGVGVAPAYTGSPSVTGSVTAATQLISSVATGTAPLVVASTTNVANLNASTLTGSAVGTSGATIPLLNAANTFSAKQTFNGSTSVAAAALVNAVEPATISATAATGTINYDLSTQSILYYTTNASANWTTNFRWSSGTSANTAMATGDVVTAVFMVTQGASPFYNNVVQVDGNAVTPKWQGGTAPSAGNASGIDIYTYSIIKTGSAAFTILASQVQYK